MNIEEKINHFRDRSKIIAKRYQDLNLLMSQYDSDLGIAFGIPDKPTPLDIIEQVVKLMKEQE